MIAMQVLEHCYVFMPSQLCNICYHVVAYKYVVPMLRSVILYHYYCNSCDLCVLGWAMSAGQTPQSRMNKNTRVTTRHFFSHSDVHFAVHVCYVCQEYSNENPNGISGDIVMSTPTDKLWLFYWWLPLEKNLDHFPFFCPPYEQHTE